MRVCSWLCVVAAVFSLVSVASAGGQDCEAPATDCGAPCQAYEVVEKTILVPTWVTETRRIKVTEYKTEQRKRSYTVCRQVPTTRSVTEDFTVMVPEQRTRTERFVVHRPVMRQVTQNYTVNVPHQETRQGTRRVCKYVAVTEKRTVNVRETRTRTETFKVCRPVTRQVTQNFTVNVPHQETREGSRKVCRWVPVTEKRTICEDQGHYEKIECPLPSCGHLSRRRCCSAPSCETPCEEMAACDAPPATYLKNVWVPNMVRRQIDVTVNRRQMFDESYTYHVTVCKPENRSRVVNVTEMVSEEKTRDVNYTVCVPKEQEFTVNRPQLVEETYDYTVTVCKPETRTRTINVCEMVAEERTRDVPYTVCVPHKRQRTYNVTEYKTVQEEKTVTYCVQVPYCVEKDVQVRVCKMVPKKVQYRVPVNYGCADQGCAPDYSQGCCGW